MAVTTIEMIRKMQDQLNKEMKGGSAHKQQDYVHQKAATARNKMSRMRPVRKAKSGKA
ncbi:MAG: hypothetical protein WC975_06670 [Phycisphaerae bacterium]